MYLVPERGDRFTLAVAGQEWRVSVNSAVPVTGYGNGRIFSCDLIDTFDQKQFNAELSAQIYPDTHDRKILWTVHALGGPWRNT